ncbi:MAG: hypothetical protein IKI11_07310 [Neisseriaceae bacterium]|nr:hypothetical protein [Neisseriaceae bacterium]
MFCLAVRQNRLDLDNASIKLLTSLRLLNCVSGSLKETRSVILKEIVLPTGKT